MQKVASNSGGRTSAFMTKLLKERDSSTAVVFMDTGAEHLKTYTFLRVCDEHFNLGTTVLRGDFSQPLGVGASYHIADIGEIGPDLVPYKNMMKKYGVPYIGGMGCTDRMKLTPFKKYCDDTYGKGNYEVWIGIRIDEPKRYFSEEVVRLLPQFENEDFKNLFMSLRWNEDNPDDEVDIWDGMWVDDLFGFNDEKARVEAAVYAAFERKTRNNIHYLFEISDATKEDVNDFWSKSPFDLEIPEWLGNCIFCPKKSDLKLAAAMYDAPEQYEQFVTALHAESVRTGKGTGKREQMYRKKRPLEKVVAQYDGIDPYDIKRRIRGSHMEDTGSCSESCEVFSNED